MLEGWRVQQLARNLATSTAGKRATAIRAFTRHADAFPWAWTAQMLDEWLGELRGVRGLARSTIRAYGLDVSAFCRYVTDPAYGWAGECQARFGTHPVQVAHEWNIAAHVQAAEGGPGKRAFTVDELQAFFDHADDQVGTVRGRGRKGWLPAFRDAALFKVAYAFGLRRTEARDARPGRLRHQPARRRVRPVRAVPGPVRQGQQGLAAEAARVLTVWDWVPGILAQWTSEARPQMPGAGQSPALWPSERGPRVGGDMLNKRFAAYRDALGLEPGLDFHSLRRSYVTHLIEDGWDPLFVQQQAGHEYASTTADLHQLLGIASGGRGTAGRLMGAARQWGRTARPLALPDLHGLRDDPVR